MGSIRNSPLFAVLCILLCMAGCLAGYVGAERLTTPPPPTPIRATPTPNAAALQSTVDYGTQLAATVQKLRGGLIFEDPDVFSSSQEENDTDVVKNTENGLLITAKQPPRIIFTISDQDVPPDIDASVTAQAVSPDPCEHWSYGLNFRQQLNGIETGAFYRLRVGSDLIWALESYGLQDSDSFILVRGNISPTFDIHKPNTIRAVVKGRHFDLYINGQKVGAADDPFGTIYPENKVGVGVVTCTTAVTVQFTNLIVKMAQ
jgi:hypothetical protein